MAALETWGLSLDGTRTCQGTSERFTERQRSWMRCSTVLSNWSWGANLAAPHKRMIERTAVWVSLARDSESRSSFEGANNPRVSVLKRIRSDVARVQRFMSRFMSILQVVSANTWQTRLQLVLFLIQYGFRNGNSQVASQIHHFARERVHGEAIRDVG